MTDAGGYAALGRRFLRPSRPRLAEAQRVVAGCYHPREAWEALASEGLIPFEWVDAPERAFRAEETRIVAGSVHAETRETTFPSPMGFAALLASDAQGIARAEALSHEVRRRLAPWTGATSPRTVWRAVSHERDLRVHHASARIEGYAPPSPYYAVWQALSTDARGVTDADALRAAEAFAGDASPRVARWQAAWLAGAQVLWNKAAEARRAVDPSRMPLFAAAPAQRFDQLEDPFAPGLALLETGYWCVGPEWLPSMDLEETSSWVLAAPDEGRP